MILEINNKQAGIDEDVSREAKRLLRFSLSRFEGVVSRLKVRFFDVNGPRGGIDKRCRISAKLKTAGELSALRAGFRQDLHDRHDKKIQLILSKKKQKMEIPMLSSYSFRRRGQLYRGARQLPGETCTFNQAGNRKTPSFSCSTKTKIESHTY